MNKNIVLLVCFSFMMVGCASAPKKRQPLPPPLVESIAILPFDSSSNNLDAPEILQRLVYLALKPSAYQVLDIEATNAQLAQKGILEGGQLAAMDPAKLAQELNVQGLIYGDIEAFGYVNLGFYTSREVDFELTLVEAASGKTLWHHTGKSSRRDVGLSSKSIKDKLVKGLTDQALDKLLRHPLLSESKEATQRALNGLQGFRFTGFATDDKSVAERRVERVKDTVNTVESIKKTNENLQEVKETAEQLHDAVTIMNKWPY